MTTAASPAPNLVSQFTSAWWQIFGAAPTSVPIVLASETAAPVRVAASFIVPHDDEHLTVNGKKLGRWLGRLADGSQTLYDLDGASYRFVRVPVVNTSTGFITSLWRLVPERELLAQEAA